jgi:error-prone DNA polymerase
VTRRDLLLQVAELDAWSRSMARANRRPRSAGRAALAAPEAAGALDVVGRAAQQSRAAKPVVPTDTQLALDLGDDPSETRSSGLPEMTGAEQVRAELEVLGLDVSRHVIDFYDPFLAAMGVTRAKHLLQRRSHSEVLVCGVKVATQTPPIRSGRRVIFVTLDDATGPLDATFFEDAQVGYASTVFHSWLLVIRGVVRRTGPRGISIRATGCWELPMLRDLWESGGVAAVEAELARPPMGFAGVQGQGGAEDAVQGAAESRSTRPVMTRPPVDRARRNGESGMGRPHVHPTGFKQSPYSDVAPSGGDARSAPRRLWHSSPGSSGG